MVTVNERIGRQTVDRTRDEPRGRSLGEMTLTDVGGAILAQLPARFIGPGFCGGAETVSGMLVGTGMVGRAGRAVAGVWIAPSWLDSEPDRLSFSIIAGDPTVRAGEHLAVDMPLEIEVRP